MNNPVRYQFWHGVGDNKPIIMTTCSFRILTKYHSDVMDDIQIITPKILVIINNMSLMLD